MTDRLIITYEMKLLSDTIPGSGMSEPGGADITVARDSDGYPLIKGTTLKGLIRESLDNMVNWGVVGQSDVTELLGEEGRDGAINKRRINVSEACLKNRPGDKTSCFSMRTFTSLEEGIVKSGSLRIAECVSKGLVFTGIIECEKQDKLVIESALNGIKWIGSLRNRGFGHVDFSFDYTAHVPSSNKFNCEVSNSDKLMFIRYVLVADGPIAITDYSRSFDNNYLSKNYITGSAMRGLVAGALAQNDKEWFEKNKAELLTDSTCFFNAYNKLENHVCIPSIKGFYEKKDGSSFVSVINNPTLPEGVKRASLGSCCAIEDEKILFWSASCGETARIKKASRNNMSDDKQIFRNRYIEKGQQFEGYISVSSSEIAKNIIEALSGNLWIGADRYEGYGKCHISDIEMVEQPLWVNKYSYRSQEEITDTLYMVAVSPFTMLDDFGNPCGINNKEISELLGLGASDENITVDVCSTSVSDYGGYNRTWGCELPLIRMYDAGSIFKIKTAKAAKLENMLAIEKNGIGIRKAEGYGSVLFIRPGLFRGISNKEKIAYSAGKAQSRQIEYRRAKIAWIINNVGVLSGNKNSIGKNRKPSASQVGRLQQVCEKTIADIKNARISGNVYADIDEFFMNYQNKKSSFEVNFVPIYRVYERLKNCKLSEILGVECDDSDVEKIGLLCELIDFNRKG